mgnify:CR=1 FL=1
MTLKQLEQEGRIRPHRTSKKEISGLFELIKRDMRDASFPGLSSDRRFATIYNAALALATIILYCRGLQSYGKAHHFTVFQAMKIILGKEYEELADYFDSCRIKRNKVDYDLADITSQKELDELMNEVKRFYVFIAGWIEKNYPHYYLAEKG